jgi:hypothetical protein
MVGDFFTKPCKARNSKDFGMISTDVNKTYQDTRKTEGDVT